jgi:hypothetical protein
MSTPNQVLTVDKYLPKSNHQPTAYSQIRSSFSESLSLQDHGQVQPTLLSSTVNSVRLCYFRKVRSMLVVQNDLQNGFAPWASSAVASPAQFRISQCIIRWHIWTIPTNLQLPPIWEGIDRIADDKSLVNYPLNLLLRVEQNEKVTVHKWPAQNDHSGKETRSCRNYRICLDVFSKLANGNTIEHFQVHVCLHNRTLPLSDSAAFPECHFHSSSPSVNYITKSNRKCFWYLWRIANCSAESLATQPAPRLASALNSILFLTKITFVSRNPRFQNQDWNTSAFSEQPRVHDKTDA